MIKKNNILTYTFLPFTHLHQIKAVGGTEESMPLITLTARKGNPDNLELRYAKNLSQTTLLKSSLTPMKGIWLEATETITFGECEVGKYEIFISTLSNGDPVFQYQNDSIRMWKTNASFLRPKWGIYRSLNDSSSLKDGTVLFGDISIEEINDPILSISQFPVDPMGVHVYPNPSSDFLFFSDKVVDVYNHFSVCLYFPPGSGGSFCEF